MEGEVSLCASSSALPWCWVIETLARSQQVNITPPLLYELVSKVPSSSGDSVTKAKEALALKILEDLFGSYNESSDNQIKSGQCGKGFDLGETCYDVFQRILCENSDSDPVKDASDELKRDVCCFIKSKKTRLARSTLELLKNTIVEGSHPLAASLKEISGVGIQNQSVERIPLNNEGPTPPSSTIEENGNAKQTMAAEEHNDSAQPDHEPAHTQLPTENSLHCERVANAISIDNPVEDIDHTSPDMEDHAPPGKKLKLDEQCSMQSMLPDSIPSGGGNEQPSGAEHGQNQFPEASGMHDEKAYRENPSCPEKGNVEDSNQPHISHDNNEPDPKKIDVQSKLSLLGSQHAFSEDSLAMTDTETNVCMKCNEAGQLLICNGSSCPLAFHVSCLGRSTHFDDQGNFYCPFCAYSQAMSEFVKAKEKVSLARKELSLFLGGKNSFQPECDFKTPSGDASKRPREGEIVNQQGQGEDANNTAKTKNHVNVVSEGAKSRQLRSSKGKEKMISAPSTPVGDPKNCANVVNQVGNAHQLKSLKGEKRKVSAPPTPPDEPNCGGNVLTEVANHRQLRSSKDKQQKHSPLYTPKVEIEYASGAPIARHIFSEDKQGAEIMVQLASNTNKLQVREQEDHGSDSCKLPYKKKNATSATREYAESERTVETMQNRATEQMREATSESISDSDGSSEDDANKTASSFHSPTPLSSVPLPANQPSRRKKVPWTAEEEAMLKKGVQALVPKGSKVFPWRSILEYGGWVFQVGRTPIDLKDKWRNIVGLRATPKLR